MNYYLYLQHTLLHMLLIISVFIIITTNCFNYFQNLALLEICIAKKININILLLKFEICIKINNSRINCPCVKCIKYY